MSSESRTVVQGLVQFNIQFKTKSKIFIQKIYSFKTIPNYSFKENIHSSEKMNYRPGLPAINILVLKRALLLHLIHRTEYGKYNFFEYICLNFILFH